MTSYVDDPLRNFQVLTETWLEFPIVVYGVTSFVAAIASLLLPIETKGRHMRVCTSGHMLNFPMYMLQAGC